MKNFTVTSSSETPMVLSATCYPPLLRAPILISLMTNYIEHLSLYLLAISICSFAKRLSIL